MLKNIRNPGMFMIVIAEALMIKGEKDGAIKNYKKSIELNPNNTGGVEQLKKLGVDYKAAEVVVENSTLIKYARRISIIPGVYYNN
ncbi:MAG: tetratricopeptide repeat protein [Ignavibacteriales bacterium]|nr:tetratricopeptide repeat protein [Ignavibacteriales bacterium]